MIVLNEKSIQKMKNLEFFEHNENLEEYFSEQNLFFDAQNNQDIYEV